MLDVLLIIHIAAAGTWLGANLMQAIGGGKMRAAGPQAQAGWYRFTGRLGGPLYMPAGILIVITGVWMVLVIDAYSFADAFVIIGLAVIVVGAILGNVVFEPTSEQAAQAAESDDQSLLRSAQSKLTTFGAIDTLLILFAITVMVLRLGA